MPRGIMWAALALVAGCKVSHGDFNSLSLQYPDADVSTGPGGRPVTSSSGGTGGPGSGPGGGGTGLPVCTKNDQLNCCYDGKKVSGIPYCGWTRLGPGESVSITTATKRGTKEKVTLPVPLTLTGAAPDAFASRQDCEKTPLGFVLSGPGLKEGDASGGVYDFLIKPDGKWVTQGDGGIHGFVELRNTDVTSRDGGLPSPKYQLNGGLCDTLATPGAQSYVGLTDDFEFTLVGVDYEVKLNSFGPADPTGEPTAYYVVVNKAF